MTWPCAGIIFLFFLRSIFNIETEARKLNTMKTFDLDFLIYFLKISVIIIETRQIDIYVTKVRKREKDQYYKYWDKNLHNT